MRKIKEGEFLNSSAAEPIFKQLEREHAPAKVEWIVDEAWADWGARRVSVILRGSLTSECSACNVSIGAKQDKKGRWRITFKKQLPEDYGMKA